MSGTVHQFGSPDRPSFFYEDPDAIDDPVLGDMLHYWNVSRRGAELPAKATFVPKEVKSYLPWLVVADATADGNDFVYKVVGTRVADYFLANGTGLTVTAAFAEAKEIGEGTLYLYRRTCELRRPTRYSGPAAIYEGVYFPAFDALYLPYTSDGLRADRLITVFVFNYDTLRQHRRPQRNDTALAG